LSILITNIKELLQVRDTNSSILKGKELNILPTLKNAFLLIEYDSIVNYGKMEDLNDFEVDEIIDASGKIVLPTWCDSHTHLVYAGDRTQEFVDRINGLTYEEIANRGGGILNSAEKLQSITEDDLFVQSLKRLNAVAKQGTGAIEIKSGYGLTAEAEIKILKVIHRLKKVSQVEVIPTLLAAHAIPKEFKNNIQGFLDMVINELIPRVSKEQLSQYIDVFCEKGYFGMEETEQILKTGAKFGMIPKIHVNQFNAFGGVALGVKWNALTVDHLEELNSDDIEALKKSNTIPVALPGCSFFLGIPYTPARKLIDSGLPLALATDYNPGSAPSGNMNFVVSAACIKMKMTPEEAINAATINGAYAMGIGESHGSITKGKKASIIITKEMPSYHHLLYAFGEDPIDTVILNGTKL